MYQCSKAFLWGRRMKSWKLSAMIAALLLTGCGGRVPLESEKPLSASRPAADADYPPRFRIEIERVDPDGIATLHGFIDQTGRVVVSPKYRDAGGYVDGLARVVLDDYRLAFIDPYGNIVFTLPEGTHTEGWFNEGLALTNQGATLGHHDVDGGLWGYIDRKGNWAIPPKFRI